MSNLFNLFSFNVIRHIIRGFALILLKKFNKFRLQKIILINTFMYKKQFFYFFFKI